MPDSEWSTHWDDAYAQGEATRSWFETEPVMSLRMIDAAGVDSTASVVDIGGGTSRLVDHLLARGHDELTVVDVSAAALNIAADRLGDRAAKVQWVRADIREFSPGRVFDVWHDRAVLHFLTDPVDQGRYRDILNTATGPGAVAVFGCFAPDGPTHCSGLPVIRRDATGLADFVGREWSMVAHERELHATPGGAVQPFTWATFVRTRAAGLGVPAVNSSEAASGEVRETAATEAAVRDSPDRRRVRSVRPDLADCAGDRRGARRG